MSLVLIILAVAALVAVIVSFVPGWELLHKVATLLLAIAAVLIAIEG